MDLIAATGLVILLKFDPNHRFFSPCDLEIRCMTSKNNRAPLLYCIKLCVSLQIHRWSYTPETLNSGRNRRIFVPCDLEFWWMTLDNNRAPLLYYIKLCASFQIHRWIETEVTVRKRSIWVKIGDFFVLCDLEIWWMTLENNRATLLYYIKLCASFQIHRWIQIGVTVRKRSIWVKMGNFLSRVTLKFDGWPWKTIGHLFYVTSSFVHHFTTISQFKLELQSGNAQFWPKSTIFFSRVSLKFNGWHSKTIGHLFYATSSFVHHFIPIGAFKFELQPGNAQFGSKSTIFLAVWPRNFTDHPQKQ